MNQKCCDETQECVIKTNTSEIQFSFKKEKKSSWEIPNKAICPAPGVSGAVWVDLGLIVNKQLTLIPGF